MDDETIWGLSLLVELIFEIGIVVVIVEFLTKPVVESELKLMIEEEEIVLKLELVNGIVDVLIFSGVTVVICKLPDDEDTLISSSVDVSRDATVVEDLDWSFIETVDSLCGCEINSEVKSSKVVDVAEFDIAEEIEFML